MRLFVPALAALTLGLTPLSAQSLSSSAGQAVAREEARRANLMQGCQEALTQAEALFAAGQYKEALERYRFVPKHLTPSASTASLFEAAISGIVASDVKLAQKAIKTYQFEEAKTYLDEAMSYRPQDGEIQSLHKQVYKELGLVSDLNAWEQNSATTPDFMKAVGQVQGMLDEVDQLQQTGQFDRAINRAKQVLVIDPYNKAAREKIKSVEENKRRYYLTAREQGREEMLYRITDKWSEQPSKTLLKGNDADSGAQATVGYAGQLTERLNRLVVDKVNFEDATIEDAVDFLRRKANELDPAAPVNFILKTQATVLAPATTDGAAAADPAAAPAVSAGPRTITLDLQSLSVIALLDLIVKQADMQYRVEDHAVYVFPIEDRIDTLETREFRCPPSFIAGVATTVEQGADAASVATASREAIKTKLTELGVDFPEGATAVYLPAGSKLIVRNTPVNLDLIQEALDQENKVTPQVAIETRFLEVNQNDLDEMSFRWNVNKRGSGQSQPTDTPGLRTSLPNPVGSLNVPRDLTVGGGGLRYTSLDTLVAQALSSISAFPLGSTLQHSFTLSKWKFEMLIYAMSQHTGSDMLSAPKVTTRSGQEAEIKVAREFTYPEEFDPPQIETTVSRLPDGNTLRLVTPSTPTSFTTEDTGVILTVNPQVGPDNLTIDLTLVPKVVEFDGFINYGSPINTLLSDGFIGVNLGYSVVKLADNIINKPVFTLRQVETKVQIADGQTVMLGGLIREDIQKVDDKLPFFGDLPLVGRAFRSKIDQSLKKNLMIFVTCNLVRPDGELFNKPPGYDDNSFRNTVDYPEVDRYSGGPDPKELK